MGLALMLLSIPNGERFGVDYQLSAPVFAALVFVVGCGMGIGKASVYKYIPDYYPRDVGAVGGLVGLLGALGGFLLPPVFGAIGRSTGVPQMSFAALLALTTISLAWLHLTIRRIHAAELAAKLVPAAPLTTDMAVEGAGAN
jgi:NNP family nitrate/nitrite transporter-like MFS transporter